LGLRISGTDWVEGGWTAEDSIVFGRAIKALGCDFIDVSSGGVSPKQQITLGPKYQVPLATQIKKGTGLLTMAVGLITEPQEAEDIIVNGEADMVALARGMLFDPRWPWHAAAQLGGQVQAAKPYWRSQPRGLSTLFGDIKQGGR
jgi:2,4-dienoyl-CoA reductase-like NADH-dependent reductase (Old Yellow Enzyme family)